MELKDKFEQLQKIYGENNLLAIVNNYVIHIKSIDEYILNHSRMNDIYKFDDEEYIFLDVVYFTNAIMNGDIKLLFYLTEQSDKIYINPYYNQFMSRLLELCKTSVNRNIKAVSSAIKTDLIATKKKIFLKSPYDKTQLAHYIEYGYYYINGQLALTQEQITVLDAVETSLSIDFVKNIIHRIAQSMTNREQILNTMGEDFEELLALRKELDLLILDIVKTAYNMFTITAFIGE